MKSGDVVFVRGNSPISSLIRLFDKGEFSHVSICVSDGCKEVLEAQYFTTSSIVPFHFSDYEIVDLDLTDEQRKQISEIAPSLTGRQYDYFQILQYIIRKIFKEFKWNNPNNMICSEIVDLLLYSVDAIPEHDYLGNLTPNELYRYLTKLKYNNT